MKRVKALQRLWAFLLAFVLIATTVGNDGLTVIAAEANTASEQESEPESTAASENDNTGEETPVLSDNSGNEEKSEVSERMQETSTESVEETFSEEYSDIDTEEETSTTENDPGEETKEAEGTLSEETQSSVWKVSFQKDGDVKILVGETEVKDSFDVEKGKELAFRLEMSEGSGSTVKAGDSELVPSEGIYKFIPDKDVTVTVKAAAIDNVETAEEETTAETESETETRTETETETETESEAETETESETETETETETESETETETEELEETEAEEGTKELFVVTFLVEGKGTITNADGDKIGDQTEVESKKALEFYVNPDEGYEIAEVVIDGTVIARTDNKYAVSPSKDVEVKVTFTEKEEEEEYIETIDTVEVNGVTIKVTTYSAGVLPKGYQVKASELDVSAVEGAVEEKLEAEGKELNQLRAFDITILDKDGKEIQPAGGVRVEISGTGVEGESVSVFHMENSGSDAEIVAKDRTSGDVSFTASSFSYYIVAGSTEIASYAKSNSYKLYCYTLIPGLQEGVSSNPNQVWNGMGVGSISGVNAPSRYSIGKIVTGQGNITYPSSYPDINVSGIAYKYAATGSENAYKEGYYTIEWFRTIVSGGANAGNNGVNPVVPFETNTFHLDGQITLNEKSKYTVTFRVQEPGNSDFTIQSDYSRRVLSGYAERDLNKPPTERKVVNGKEYIFEGWYRDKNCTIKADFNGQITGNTDYYGKYILNEKVFKYTVKHWVDGETCDEDSVLVEVALSEEAAGIKDIELKKYSGYKYERNDKNLQLNKNRTALVGKGTIENNGVINVYYTLNEDAKLNYSVEYYLEGTDAPFDTLKDQSVLVAKPEVKAVADSSNVPAGYTRSTTAPKLPTTITASNNVIKVYYKADESQKLDYRVEYYLEGTDAPFDTLKDQNVLVAQPEVKAVVDSSKVPAGYTRSTTAPKLPTTITASNNVIKVYYKADESQKLDYRVEYYVEGTATPFDTLEDQSVLVAKPEVKAVADSSKVPAGYTRSTTAPKLPATITATDNVIKVYYKADESQKLNYSVEYYLEGTDAPFDTLKDQSVLVAKPEVKAVADSSNVPAGYTRSTTAPKLPTTITASNNVIKVYYKADESQKLDYRVEYYLEGTDAPFDTLKDQNVLVAQPEVKAVVDSSKVPAGYTRSTTAPKLPTTITASNNVIKVYYKADENQKLNYSVEYYLEGTDAPFDTLKDQSVLVAKPEVKAVADSSNVPAGYTRSTTAPKLPATITATDNVIKVYYKADENQKLNYSVEYYLEGMDAPFDTLKDQNVLVAKPEVKAVADSGKVPAGYTRSTTAPKLPATITVTDNVIKVYYKVDESQKLDYSIEYYLEGEVTPFDTLKDQSVLVAKPEVKAVADSSKVPAGYIRSTTAPKLPTTITASNNVIKVYYKVDESQKLDYSVEYYVEGKDAPFDTLKDQNVLVAKPEVKAVADSGKVPAGYTRSTTAPKLPATITVTDNVIKVYYKVDESQKLDYSIEYYLEGEVTPFDTLKDQSVLVAKPEVIAVADSGKVPAGYTRSRTAPKLPATITATDNVIKVYYKVDESQKLDYRVEYYLEGMDAPFDTLKDQNVLVAEPEVKEVADSSNVPAGYTRSRTAPKLPTTITASNNVIKVYYKADESQKLDYRVEYYLEGMDAPFDTLKDQNVLVAEPEVKAVADSSNVPAGYTRSTTAPKLPATITATDNVIKVYYKVDESQKLDYSVEHYLDGETFPFDITTQLSVLVASPEVKNVSDSDTLPAGYTRNRVEPVLPTTITKENKVIKIIYSENEITINYTADTNGSVTNASETIHAVSGKPQGSTATASNGYHFVNWTNEAGEVVSTDVAYVPVKVNGLHVAATYTAHFAANTPTPTDPTPDPTPGTPTTATPTATTAVLGEAFAPVQPEVGVLGEALAPEVGVLGEAKGPGTGDTAPIAGWSFLIMGAILTLGVTAKRRKKEEE